ncbi:hypothetical protein HIM_05247 [Hirsutella minnesotensis 3608]|uniref:Transaldolase n=1 Tax=Hirsutella minnesotensis 3608 TaxID=1043627 RepID=A0A0F7ZKK0_9HYPO|nr:hypothetical protein HIM_05247 [Hirsutella minnesotensis 3608]
MASNGSSLRSPVNVLEYLQSRSSIDYDSLTAKDARELGSFADCTSNQWEAYSQLSDAANSDIVQESLDLAKRVHTEYQNLSIQELAVEVAMIRLSLRMIPLISGSIHVMCNPFYAWDTEQVYQTGHRFHKICRQLDPGFDLSRLIMKVPATWEGLQACRRLRTDCIKTLATTLFTMEQAVLAGEAGCISISPFAHELRAHLETNYHDSEPVLNLIVQAQRYFKQHGISTKVKSCAFMTSEEIICMAGVDAMTLPAEVLQELASMSDLQESLEAKSVFLGSENGLSAKPTRLSYINDRTGFLRAFATNGRGKAKTEDALSVFCTFQLKAEEIMKQAGDL